MQRSTMRHSTWAWLAAAGITCCGMGCDQGGDFKPADQLPQAAHEEHGHDHDHAAEGPHHGALIEIGAEEFHGELVVDHKTHALKLYLLGPDAKTDATTAATEASLQIEGGPKLTLKAASGQPEGQTSLFELVDAKVVEEIEEAGFIHGELMLKIGEKEYKAGVDAHFHGDHDHDHDHAEMPAKEEAAPAADAAPAAETAPPADAPKPE